MSQPNSASLIFPPLCPIPEVLGSPRLRSEVMAQLHQDPGTLSAFHAISPPEQEAFLEFCMGNRGLKVTYDPFFQYLFHPETHPGRLDRLLTCIMGQKARVKKVLPRERTRIGADSSLIIMDILVELANGALVSVEMQRIGYVFPIERCFCYGADLLVRQYDLVRKRRGKQFSYRDMKPVCVIVLMERSPGIFRKMPGHYIHRSLFSFDSGLAMEPLENFIYISLDIFRDLPHNELTELDAWMYFLGSDSPADILCIVKKYPFFQPL